MLTVGKLRTLLSQENKNLQNEKRNAYVAYEGFDFCFSFILELEECDHFIGLISDKSYSPATLSVSSFLTLLSYFADKTPVRSEYGDELRLVAENSFTGDVRFTFELFEG